MLPYSGPRLSSLVNACVGGANPKPWSILFLVFGMVTLVLLYCVVVFFIVVVVVVGLSWG